MSTLKTVTSAVTAAVLVAGIGFAVAQSEDQPSTQPLPATPLASDPSQAADPNATPPREKVQQSADTSAKDLPPADQAMPPPRAFDPIQPAQDRSRTLSEPAAEPHSEPAPKADRN